MKTGRIFVIILMLLCANVIFGQIKNTISISLNEIKDMPQKIISAYFKPVYSSTGVYYPLMQWYAFENKVDTWDKNALTKLNASIYEFMDKPAKAAEFALQFCRSFGERDFINNFEAIGFNSQEINLILRCYRAEKRWQEIDNIKKWQNVGTMRHNNNDASVSAKYHIYIDDTKMKKFLSNNIKRNMFDDYVKFEIRADGTYSLNDSIFDFVQVSDIIPAKKEYAYLDTLLNIPVYSKIKITENMKNKFDYKIELDYDIMGNRWKFKDGTFRVDNFWKQINKSTPYFNYINVAIEKLLDKETLDAACQYELEFSMGTSVIKVSQADMDSGNSQQETIYNNKDIPVINLTTLYKKSKDDSLFEKNL